MLSKFYDRYWRSPDLYNMGDLSQDPWTVRRLQMFLRQVPPGLRVADVGAGTGGGVAVLTQAGHTVTGIEVSPAAVEEAKRRYPDKTFICCSLEDGQCPLPDASFDAIFCGEVIEHIYDVDTFLGELRRLIRPGGFLAITTPYNGFIKTLLILCTGRFDINFDPRGPHIRFFSVKAIRQTMEDNGFEVKSIDLHGRFPPISNGMFVMSIRKP